MNITKLYWIAVGCFLAPGAAMAWGGPEHSAITAAAVSVLSPAVLAFLGSESVRLIKTYCNYPDFNWAVYGTCVKNKSGTVRLPDDRRNFEVSKYCDFDEFTGYGDYYGHGPEIGKETPPPDEHAAAMDAAGRYSHKSIAKFAKMALSAYENGNYFDSIRFSGVVCHYLQDNTPPPHTLGIPGGGNILHKQMEAIEDLSLINIDGYSPEIITNSKDEFAEVASARSLRLALQAQAMARKIMILVEQKRHSEAKSHTVECARMAARATADLLTTFHSLYGRRLPVRPVSISGVNLLFNPSFDLDADGDLQPDGWVREWYDLSCPCDQHLWDQVSVKYNGGACVRLYCTTANGAAWRTAKTRALPVNAGETYELTGRIRLQSSSGENYLALKFQDADYEIIGETTSEILSGPCNWKTLRIKASVPANAVDMLVACVSKNNPGSVLFDDLDLRLVSS